MTDRVFQDETCFNVSGKYGDASLHLYEDRSVQVKVTEQRQSGVFNITAEEATMLKEFLISKGY